MKTGRIEYTVKPEEKAAMLNSSTVDPATIRAYRETHFMVEAETPMTLRVDERNEALAALHEAASVESSAFITAWNPYSQKLDDDLNARRHEELADELAQHCMRAIRGVGKHPVDEWGEPSFLVLGISLKAAKELGARYEQNAIIWCGADAIPQLILLR